MDIGFVGLGNMGFEMARRLVEAEHKVVAFDARPEVLDRLVNLGAQAGTSPRDLADRTQVVLASLPSLQASLDVATGPDGVIHGTRAKCFVDLSTVGAGTAAHIAGLLAAKGITQIDSPVSGGVTGARNGTLAMMVSGPDADVEAVRAVLETLGRVFVIGEKPGSAQTMKLANNLLAATTLAATSEAVVMGVKAGLDPAVMIEVFNAGSGSTHASRDKFPRAILPRTFDFGFATGLMVKALRLCLQEARAAGLSLAIADAVERLWDVVLEQAGADSDFTSVIKPIEQAAGVVVVGPRS